MRRFGMLFDVLHENRQRAEIFGDDAEQYDRSRPGYPEASALEAAASNSERW